MKYSMLIMLILTPFSVLAEGESSVIDLKVKAEPVSDVAKLVISKCEGKAKPIIVDNPERLISLDLE